MANWAKPKYPHDQVDLAGKAISENVDATTREQALEVVNNWRSAHSYPLNYFQIQLRRVARAVSNEAVVAQRLKRLPTIEAKLRREDLSHLDLTLSGMQDIAGCRAIMPTCAQARSVADQFKQSGILSEFERETDYISRPKKSGYRSHHLIYRYRTRRKAQKPWEGLRVEIQIRSRDQHAWAAAVETVDMFTKQALKSSAGNPDWQRFFVLMSGFMAMEERASRVPRTPNNREELLRELYHLTASLEVIPRMELWGTAASVPDNLPGAKYYLLQLDTVAKRVSVRRYTDVKSATTQYGILEKSALPSQHLVLVSGSSLSNLRKAYPSYFSDTTRFVALVKDACLRLTP